MKLHVTGGRVATGQGLVEADLLCDGGVIAGLLAPGTRVDDAERLDATGRLVLPGFIDPHVHSRDPGMEHKEDFEHSTRGALVGGTTTVLEMPNAIPPVDSAAMFAERRARHERSAWTDFGLWGLALGDPNLDAVSYTHLTLPTNREV